MSSFSLELQVRASQELVAKQMPKRSILVRAMLFAETASALLLIEFGLFTHPAMIVIPFFVMALVSLPRENFSKGEKFQFLELRSFFSSLLTPKHYSAFGLRRRQENTRLFIWTMMILRLICAVVVTKSLSDGCLVGCPYYHCEVETYTVYSGLFKSKRKEVTYRWMMAGFGNSSVRDKAETCFPDNNGIFADAMERMCGHRTAHGPYNGESYSWPVFPDSIVPPDEISLCDPEALAIPGIMAKACYSEDLDPVAYQYCLSTPQGHNFPGYCAQVFFFCSSIRAKDSGLRGVLVAAYMFVPICGFFLLILLHLLPAFFGQSGMMNVPEDKDLRQAIRARTRQLEQELQTGRPQSSLWWDRRAFEFKMSFLVIDVLLDAWSCFGFFRDGAWVFAVCQLLLLVMSFFVELRSIGFKQFFFAIAESWKAGLPSDLVCLADPVIYVCLSFSLNLLYYNVTLPKRAKLYNVQGNEVHTFAVGEKTFEAPLSLFFQYGSAFYGSKSFTTFGTLMLSILTSGVGIANGLYIANHLSFMDVEDVDLKDQVMPPHLTNKFGAELPEFQPSKIGHPVHHQPMTLPQPPGLQPVALPQPPGLQPMVLPQPPGLGKPPRRPGQFVSDTE